MQKYSIVTNKRDAEITTRSLLQQAVRELDAKRRHPPSRSAACVSLRTLVCALQCKINSKDAKVQ